MESMSIWLLYFLPSIIAWIRLRMGKTIPTPFGKLFVFNLFLAWTVVGWILAMLEAFGYNPVPWMAVKYLKVFGVTRPMNTPQSGFAAPQGGSSASPQGQVCGQCGGTGSIMCSHCQGRGSWYTQPTRADEVAQLQTCSYCMSSGHIRCPYCGGARV